MYVGVAGNFQYGSRRQSQKPVPGIWKHARSRGAKGFSATLKYRREMCGFTQARQRNEFGNGDREAYMGEGKISPRRKGKTFFSGDARSRGVLSTWELPIG